MIKSSSNPVNPQILDIISTSLDNHLILTQIYAPDDEFTFLGYRFVNGEVYAPPPPEIKNGQWVSNDSGTPYFRLNQRPAKSVSRPPKACSIVKPVTIPSAPISHYWINEMSTLYVTDQGAYLNVYHQQFQVLYKGN